MSEPPTTIDPGRYAAWRATPLGAITERLELDLVFQLVGRVRGKSVLDVGTGDGKYALEAASRGADVTGVDVDPKMLRAGQQRAEAMKLDVTFMEGRADRLPVADRCFDVVLAVTVLCFVEDPVASFRELARVLRPVSSSASWVAGTSGPRPGGSAAGSARRPGASLASGRVASCGGT